MEKNPTPQDLINDLKNPQPGWSQKYGGPEGIITHTKNLQQELAQQSQTIAALRTTALQELLKTKTGAEVARDYGLTRSAITKLNKREYLEIPTW